MWESEARFHGCGKGERTWLDGNLLAGRVANGPEVYGAVGLVLDDGIANSIYDRCECK